jgi:hypothetical protein
LQLLEDFSGATSHVADSLGDDAILPEHAQNLLDLPSRLLHVPGRILGKVFPVDIKSSAGHELSA